jgi:spore coat protein U-like protein
MSMTKFSDFTGANATAGIATSGTLNGGTQSIYVGGTLNVSASQAAGEYTGQITVTVEYN